MRPLLLTIQAFGPFAEKETIDFRILNNRSLFLIHGPTGSGKTTILDAICFALYGESSGLDRDVHLMRSDFSNEAFQTEITLTFSLGADVYKVLRIPEQERAKLRGSGTTKKTSTATLWKADSNTSDADFTVIADRWNRVTEKIEELLGFRSDQFRQVVIMPQGDFRRLLSASSQERQEILTTLFRTSRYKQYEDELKSIAKSIKDNYDSISTQLQFNFQETNTASIDELTTAILSVESEIQLLSDNNLESRKIEKNILDKLSEAKEINARFKELEEAQTNHGGLLSRKATYEQLQLELNLLEKALFLKNQYDNCSQLDSEFNQFQQNKKHSEIIAKESLKKKECAAFSLQQAEKKLSEREDLLSELNLLRQIEPKLISLEQSRKAVSDFQQKFDLCSNDLTKKKEHLVKIKDALERIQNELTSCHERALLLDIHKNKVREIERYCKDSERLAVVQKDLQSVKPALDNAIKEHILLSEEFDQCKNKIEKFDEVRQKFQAASLANTLADGCPCPVCGSTIHPNPAISDVYIPDEKEIQKLKVQQKKLDSDREKLRTIIEHLRVTIANHENEIILLNESLINSPSQDLFSLKNLLSQHDKSVKDSIDASTRLEKLSDDKKRGDLALADSEKAIESLINEISNINADLRSQELMVQKLKTEIPEKYSSIASATDILHQKENAIKEIDSAYETARKNFEFSNEQYIVQNTSLQKILESEELLKAKISAAKNNFLSELQKEGFHDLNHYLQCLSKVDQITSVKEQLQQFHLAFHAAEQRLQRAISQSDGYSKIDLTVLENSSRDIQQKIESLTKQIATSIQKRDNLITKKDAISKLSDQIKLLDQQFGVAGRLSEVANGNNPLRITFERFILASLLDEVLFAGTRRLKIMSRGRFELHRSLTSNDLRTSGGLDLQIFDTYTGTSRPATSLSGGESFLAALSLALGLADIVQSHAGGIKLETIFIDEGFGSLDSEALDLAFQALSDLGQGGRLVGIISHVAELQERIDTRLELLADKTGSHTRFVV